MMTASVARAQRARSRRFPQGDVLWRAPRPERERMATSVRVARPHFGASRRSIAVLVAWLGFAWLGFAWLGFAWRSVAVTMARCLDDDSDAGASRERACLRILHPSPPLA